MKKRRNEFLTINPITPNQLKNNYETLSDETRPQFENREYRESHSRRNKKESNKSIKEAYL